MGQIGLFPSDGLFFNRGHDFAIEIQRPIITDGAGALPIGVCETVRLSLSVCIIEDVV